MGVFPLFLETPQFSKENVGKQQILGPISLSIETVKTKKRQSDLIRPYMDPLLLEMAQRDFRCFALFSKDVIFHQAGNAWNNSPLVKVPWSMIYQQCTFTRWMCSVKPPLSYTNTIFSYSILRMNNRCICIYHKAQYVWIPLPKYRNCETPHKLLYHIISNIQSQFDLFKRKYTSFFKSFSGLFPWKGHGGSKRGHILLDPSPRCPVSAKGVRANHAKRTRDVTMVKRWNVPGETWLRNCSVDQWIKSWWFQRPAEKIYYSTNIHISENWIQWKIIVEGKRLRRFFRILYVV